MRPSPLLLWLAAVGCDDVLVDIASQNPPPPSTTLTGDTSTPLPAPEVDAFVYDPGRIDVLYIIDNSCSMAPEQADLVADLPLLHDALVDRDLDFHLGFVTTDMEDPDHAGRLLEDVQGRRFIDADTPDPEALFALAAVGTAGSSIERGLQAAWEALGTHREAHNAGFRRDDAMLAQIVLSDEADFSKVSTAEFIDDLEAEAAHPGDVTFSSVVAPLRGCDEKEPTYISRYVLVTDAVGGVTAPTCDIDYPSFYADVAAKWWASVPYALSSTPDATTLEVHADLGDGLEVIDAASWVYDEDENTVRLVDNPGLDVGAALEVHYLLP